MITNIASCSVVTSRSELTNDYSVKFNNLFTMKRKSHEEETVNEPWVKTLLANLRKCNQGIQYECEVLSHLKDCKFLRKGKKRRQLSVVYLYLKLASIPKCASDTIFNYSYNQEDHYYIRYLEAGFYTGFYGG